MFYSPSISLHSLSVSACLSLSFCVGVGDVGVGVVSPVKRLLNSLFRGGIEVQ